MHLLSLIAGLAAIGTVLLDAFETMILPRRATGKIRLTRLFYILTWTPWAAIARRIRGIRRRETTLSFYGPLSLLFLMATWAFGLILGFALLYYGMGTPFSDPLGYHGLRTCLYVSGTTVFTLGIGDVIPHTRWARDLIVVEAGIGLGFVAVVIGYLPVLYGAFSKRESTISLLDPRAGSPPTAAELLSRHAFDGGAAELTILFAEWERWSAELLESHISYPLLCYFRSQHDNQSWLSALTAILDATTLTLSVLDNEAARQAHRTFAMARHAVVDIAQVFALDTVKCQHYATTHADRLNPEQWAELRGFLFKVGLEPSQTPETLLALTHLREMYQGQVLALSQHLQMPLQPFLADTEKRDTWAKVAKIRQPCLDADPDRCAEIAHGRREQLLVDDSHPF